MLRAALDLLDAVAFDDVADAHVLVVLEGHAAFLAGDDFLDLVLEALEGRQLAFVDDDIVADQAHIGAALDVPSVTRQPATLPTLEMLNTSWICALPSMVLAQGRGQQAGHGRLHVIHKVVDDVVIADLDADLFGEFARLLVGANVEADDGAPWRLRPAQCPIR